MDAAMVPDAEGLRWHDYYLDAFREAASSDSHHRHQRAAFVLSNFARFPEGKNGLPAGLSGIFLPFRAPKIDPPTYTTVYIYEFGRLGSETNLWRRRVRSDQVGNAASDGSGQDLEGKRDWSSLGHVVSLPEGVGTGCAAVLGFTIDRLPRELNHWGPLDGLCDFSFAEMATADSPKPFDRLVVSAARALGARLITRDGVIQESGLVETIWS